MRKDMRKGIKVPAGIEGFDEAQAFIKNLLDNTSVSPQIASEKAVVFEAVFNAVLMQAISPGTTLDISAEDRLGSICLKIGYEGKRFAFSEEDDDGLSLEFRILEGYADKISHSYRFGYNVIRLYMRKSPRGHYLSCGAGILLAIAVYAVINAFIGYDDQKALLDDYVFPFERLFANAMLMVGAPVTFFSLLKNASDTFVISERSSNARRLRAKSIVTSAFAVLLALGLCFALAYIFSGWRGYVAEFAGEDVRWTFSEAVISMVPDNVFEPFTALSPIPLIVVALLVTNALCSASEYFDVLKTAIEACYELFSHMLSIVMVALPVACFLSILDVLLDSGGEMDTNIGTLVLILFAIVSTGLVYATYAIRLKLKGVKVGPFVKKLLPLLRENIAIGSVIDAVPYNVRYCARHYGMDRRRVSRAMPVLAQNNLDGNCYLLMLVAMLFVFASGLNVSAVNIAVIAALVLFLSFGAPNQPGSILIGTLIIITYLGSYDMICMAFYLEVFLGGLQNLINVISCIVMVAEEEGVRYRE